MCGVTGLSVGLMGNLVGGSGGNPTSAELLGQELEANGVSVVYGGRGLGRIKRSLSLLTTAVTRSMSCMVIDVYSGRGTYVALIMGMIARLRNIPVFLVLHGGALPQFSQKRRRLCERVLSLATTVIAPSRYLQTWAKSLGYHAQIIPNPIHLQGYTFQHRIMDTPRLYWVRRYHEVYNPQLAIRVLAGLKPRFPDADLRMAGPDSGERGACERLAQSLGVASSIEFLPRITKEEISALAHDRNIFLNTTHVDNTPVTMLEAAALGLPIVSTNVGGIPFIFTDHESALLVQSDNVDAMVQAITQYIENPALAEQCANNAYAMAQRCDWAKVIEQWNRVLSNAAA